MRSDVNWNGAQVAVVVTDGQIIRVERPRLHCDGKEVPIMSYKGFQIVSDLWKVHRRGASTRASAIEVDRVESLNLNHVFERRSRADSQLSKSRYKIKNAEDGAVRATHAFRV